MTEEQAFQAALDLPDEAARAAYLDKTCGEDAAFRRQVEALLAAHFKSGEFLDVPAAEQGQADSRHDNTVAHEGDAPSPRRPSEKGGKADDNTVAHEGDAVPAARDREDEGDELPFLTPSSRPDSLGRLGHYEMLQVLGKGGFGIVFRAFDETLQRVVAVKVMAPQIATLSPARKRFLREARSSAQVRHENVVQVYEVGEQPLPYLAMEFIPGETLQQKLDRSGPLEVSEVLRIGRQIAEGLAAAHACDLIHRDIKPGNILLEGGSQKAKITDFGLARAADDASISQSGIIAGTPMFMAPEQALGRKIDQRADLFSLGSVLYQMASGRPPFRAPPRWPSSSAWPRSRRVPFRRSFRKRPRGCATSSPSCTRRTRTSATSRRGKQPTCWPTARPSSRPTPRSRISRASRAASRGDPGGGSGLPWRRPCCFP